MASTPKISVVLTAYRGTAFIGRAIESLLRQSLRDFELIIVEDASGDGTLEAIRAYEDPRIRIIAHETNQGISASRNAGIAAARAPYVAMQDQDDVSLPDRLTVSCAALEAHPNAVLVAGRTRYQPDGSLFPREPLGTPAITAFRLFTRSNFYTSSISFRVAALEKLSPIYDPAFPYAEDFVLYHQMAAIGDLLHLPDILTEVHKHGANASIQHEAEMSAHARRFLKTRYEALLGETLSEQDMQDVWRLGNDGVALPDLERTRRCGELWDALVPAFISQNRLNAETALAIRQDASRRWWHLLKLSAQKLGPGVLSLPREFPHLHDYQPTAWDSLKTAARAWLRR